MKEEKLPKWRKDPELIEEAEKRLKMRWYEDDVKFLFGLHVGMFIASAKAYGLDFGFEDIHLIFRSPNEYPDAILYNEKKKEALNVEFEWISSEFKRHHPPELWDRVDLIVCMVHDWKECPIPVYELSALPEEK